MDVKEFLLTSKEINLTGIALKMYKTNKGAQSYLSRKLNGIDNRTFTKKDGDKALEVLNELADEIKKLKNP